MNVQQERDRNRNLATTLVSLSIVTVGVAFLGFALVLFFKGGGAGGFFIGLIMAAFAVAILAAGFFFQLVPLKVDALAQEKRDYDVRVQEKTESDGDEQS